MGLIVPFGSQAFKTCTAKQFYSSANRELWTFSVKIVRLKLFDSWCHSIGGAVIWGLERRKTRTEAFNYVMSCTAVFFTSTWFIYYILIRYLEQLACKQRDFMLPLCSIFFVSVFGGLPVRFSQWLGMNLSSRFTLGVCECAQPHRSFSGAFASLTGTCMESSQPAELLLTSWRLQQN